MFNFYPIWFFCIGFIIWINEMDGMVTNRPTERQTDLTDWSDKKKIRLVLKGLNKTVIKGPVNVVWFLSLFFSLCMCVCVHVCVLDSRLHHLTGCSGPPSRHSISQYHTIRVSSSSSHLPPVHCLLPNTQGKSHGHVYFLLPVHTRFLLLSVPTTSCSLAVCFAATATAHTPCSCTLLHKMLLRLCVYTVCECEDKDESSREFSPHFTGYNTVSFDILHITDVRDDVLWHSHMEWNWVDWAVSLIRPFSWILKVHYVGRSTWMPLSYPLPCIRTYGGY